MHNRLVKEEKAAVVVFGGADIRKGPGLFRFVAAANVGVDIAKCEELMFAEIETQERRDRGDGAGEIEDPVQDRFRPQPPGRSRQGGGRSTTTCISTATFRR